MINTASYNDERRIVKKTNPNVHIMFDIINDDWLIDCFEGMEESGKMIINKSVTRPTTYPMISSGTF